MRSISAVRTGLVALIAGALIWACGGPSKPPGPTWAAPLTPDAYSSYLRGQLAGREGNHAEAILHFRIAAQWAPKEAYIQLALIGALLRAERTEQAYQHALRACERWPHEPDVWLACGAAYRRAARSGKTADKRAGKRAIRAFRRAVRLAPALQAAHLGLADAYLAAGQRTEALAVYQRYLATAPAAPDARAARQAYAEALLAGGDYAEAAEQLREVLAADFNRVSGYRELAHALRFADKDRASLRVLRQGFARSGDLRLGLQLARQLAEAGLRAEVVAVLDQLASLDLDQDGLLAVGEAYLGFGAWRPAAALGARASARESPTGHGALVRAQALALGRRSDEAVAILLAVSGEAAAFPECRALAARLLTDAGQGAAATEALAPGLSRHPYHRELLISQAYVLARRQRPERAHEVLKDALARSPANVELRYALAALHRRQGRTQPAVALMEQTLAEDADDVRALVFIGASLAERGRELARAERLLTRAVRLAPGDAAALRALGWLRYRQERFGDARRVLERAARMFPHDPEVLFYLGEVTLAQRDRARALDLMREARALAPGEPLASRIDARIRALSTGLRQ